MRAVIVDCKGRYAAALCEDGTVRRVADAAYAPGQTVELPDGARSARSGVRRALTVAAAAALVAVIGAGTAYALPYGTVSLDAPGAVEYTINCFDYVLDVRAADDEGAALLSGLDTRALLHRPIGRAVAQTVAHCTSGGGPARVATGTRSPAHSEKLDRALTEIVERQGASAAAETAADAPAAETPETASAAEMPETAAPVTEAEAPETGPDTTDGETPPAPPEEGMEAPPAGELPPDAPDGAPPEGGERPQPPPDGDTGEMRPAPPPDEPTEAGAPPTDGEVPPAPPAEGMEAPRGGEAPPDAPDGAPPAGGERPQPPPDGETGEMRPAPPQRPDGAAFGAPDGGMPDAPRR